MVAINPALLRNREDWIAELTQVAYRSVLARGFRGSFLDLELSLWRAIREAVERTTLVDVRTAQPSAFADAATR
jgi:hypothetical protein